MQLRLLLPACVTALGVIGLLGLQERPGRMLDAKLHHLGNDATPDWKEAAREPEGTRLDVRFTSRANTGEWLIFVRQRSVDNTWRLKANGVEIALLRSGAELVERAYAVPKGSFKEGENVLSFEPDVPTDDVVLGEVRLVEQSLRELYHLQPLRFRVTDDHGAPLPARITLIAADGSRPPIYYAESATTAAREGVLYTANGEAACEVPAGTYTTFATRGPEWSLSQVALTTAAGATPLAEHVLRRELDTRGFVAADTHIHTLQFSGHGDASALERQVTLAGEGVELAIATDHNHNTDYGPFQREAGVTPFYTAVCGNEVTTEIGHFNAFPLDPREPVPPYKSLDIVTIVAGIRARGARVVILNHPRWPNHDDSPFGHHHLDHLLGRFDPPLELPVDATEMINATTEEQEPLLLFRDWFSLLNRGVRIFAVGSSDSHTVGEPVGQGRTSVTSASDDPAAIDVAAACDALKNGRTSISMGCFVTVAVDGRSAMGSSFERSSDSAPFEFDVRVQAPSWVRARRATVFVNGLAELVLDVRANEDGATDDMQHVSLPLASKNDAWIVVVVQGDGISTPAWPQVNPYTLAATNPMFVDRDGGGYSSPAAMAAAFAPKATDDSMRARLATLDATHALHFIAAWAAELRSNGIADPELRRRCTEVAGAHASHEAVAELLRRL